MNTKLSLLLTSLLIPVIGFAFSSEPEPAGVGAVAGNLLDPVALLTEFVVDGSLITGILFLFACIVRYKQYRRNPLETPLSTVVMLLVCGLVLLVIPIVYKLAQ